MGKDAFESAVNIGKMADKTGLSTQSLSVFHKVAGDVGVSTEAVDKGLTKAAKSITEFEQGSQKAAKGFGLLGLKATDFAGLKPDEKIALVTDRLGKMQAGFAKATATQLIFSRGGAEMIPVLNALAAQGMDKATASTAKLGLLLDQENTDTFKAAKASIQELTDVGKGMATQFEAGLLPSINDVTDALLDSTIKGGDGFDELGKIAGKAIRGIAFFFFGLGDSVGAILAEIEVEFGGAWDEIKTGGTAVFEALGLAARGNLQAAWQQLKYGARDVARTHADTAGQVRAIWDQTAVDIRKKQEDLFLSDEEEARRKKARIARLKPEHPSEAPEVTAPAAPRDAAAKAALALLLKQMEDELSIRRAYAKQSAQIDKELYEEGHISLKEYFDRRRAEVLTDTQAEVALMNKGLADAKAEADRLGAEAAGATDPAKKDKLEGAHLQALAKVDELQTKITEKQIESGTKIKALDTEQFKAQQENQAKILEFEKLIDTSSGKRLEAAKAEIAIEKQKMAVILEQSGASQAQIAAELARYEQVKLADVAYTEQQKDGTAAMKELADKRAAIEDQVKNGKLFQVQADEQIRQLELERLPVLEQMAAELAKQAELSGDETKKAQAADFQKQVDQIAAQANQAGQQIAQIKQGMQGALTGGVTQFFDTMMAGTVSVGQAFKQLAGSIVSSLARMMAQMVAQVVIAKMLKAAMSGFSGGGLVPGGGGGGGGTGEALGFAGGGLITGPGGPKSDSIPARVSPGEFIVNADAVSKVGAGTLDAINRGLKIPSLSSLALPKFAEGGLVGAAGGGDSNINLGIGLDEGLILKHLSSKSAANIILQHLANNPKAANKAISRSS